MQFKAGYIADTIARVITDFKATLNKHHPADQTNLGQLNGLLECATSFEVAFYHDHHPDFKNLNPVLAVINNIISRGLPTRAPVFLEEVFSDLGLTKKEENPFEINFPTLGNPIKYDTLFELLHIIEPQLEINKSNYGGNPGSDLEWDLIERHPFLKQILDSQRDFATINTQLAGGRSVDFCLMSPYLHWNEANQRYERHGRIIEVDGPHHLLSEYRFYDAYRDAIAENEHFETIRYTAGNIRRDNTDFEALIGRQLYHHFRHNFERNVGDCLAEYSLLFIPLAVARLQKTILELLLVRRDLFTQAKIEIAVVERDLPCGAIAIHSLQELFSHINAILCDKDQLILPEISLTIFENRKWVIDGRLHLQAPVRDEVFFHQTQFDIILDHSILRRSNIYKETDFQNENSIKIRSAHFCDTAFGKARRVYCADLLRYNALVKKKDDGSYVAVPEYTDHINFFIQTIFRKVSFREGQLPIISRALQHKPVIGLLPTGGGKSLTFQLPAFLQPALCLIVDPIKSLMEDQVRVLSLNWIDCCDFINSNLSREEKKAKLIELRYGETMFLFISPERFVMKDFRTIIQSIDASPFGLAFSYCVIDEVHCVSEWGHDFRSTYLMLGRNAQRFAKTKSGKEVSLLGLTATASFDVLADIERELQIKHNDVADAIIMIENTIRPELFLRVIDVTNKDRMLELNAAFSNMGPFLQRLNDPLLLQKSYDHHRANFDDSEDFNPNILIRDQKGRHSDLSNYTQNDFYAIVFCPVKGQGGHPHGVDFVYTNLDSGSKGYFYASDEDVANRAVQEHFQNFTSGRTKHIVCTKAFGMGIDKKDIRATYHYVYSGSLESLVQEAGRCGRDKKIAQANVFISQRKYVKVDVFCFFSKNQDDKLIQNRFTRKAIRQAFEKRWNEQERRFDDVGFPSSEAAIAQIDTIDFSLLAMDGTRYNNLPPASVNYLRDKFKEKDENNRYRFITDKYEDRNIHDYFFGSAFKGVDTERSQFLNLFEDKEFQVVDNKVIELEGQDTLRNTFDSCQNETYPFTLTATREYPDAIGTICRLLNVNPGAPINPPGYMVTFQEAVRKAYEWANDFTDFIFLLGENDVRAPAQITAEIRQKLRFVYNRDRSSSNDTGRLIYRMHSMGFLDDYLIDYNNSNLYYCIFHKYKSIDNYLNRVESYLRRYLSENTAMEKMAVLRKRLLKTSLVENIIECLYFLSEFAYEEIASKRKRATDEIETILNTSLTEPKFVSDWFEQNLYIKEQIYFYFNAKYARIGFKINGKPFSLLDDYTNASMSRQAILDKYLNVYREDGTEQNNYKHMMGSCKKILRSMSETDLNREWLLRLLKAFSMYSVNNVSYISEANAELELGFDNLYKDERFHLHNFETIEPIFESYFTRLQGNIQEDNPSFNDIKLIRVKLLLKMQTLGIEMLITKNYQYRKEMYA